MELRKFSIPEIVFGRGSLRYAGRCARRLGAEKIFLVSDPGLEQAGWVDHLAETLEQEKFRWVYYNDIDSNPRDFQVKKGAASIRRQRLMSS